jgi:hypothetical protein
MALRETERKGEPALLHLLYANRCARDLSQMLPLTPAAKLRYVCLIAPSHPTARTAQGCRPDHARALAAGAARRALCPRRRREVRAESTSSQHSYHGRHLNPTPLLTYARTHAPPHPPQSYVKAHYRAAVALERLGRPADAERHAQRAVDLDPSNRQAADLLGRLRRAAGTRSSVQAGGGGGAAEPAAAAGASQSQRQRHQDEKTLTESAVLAALPAALRAASRVIPSPDGLDANVLVLLHGLGDKPGSFVGG